MLFKLFFFTTCFVKLISDVERLFKHSQAQCLAALNAASVILLLAAAILLGCRREEKSPALFLLFGFVDG